jgi:hypothetical protein
MTAPAIRTAGVAQALRAPASLAVRLLQFFGFSIMAFPTDSVIKAVGAGGYAAALFAYVMFFSYLAAVLYGLHNPLNYRSPVRIALCVLWLSSLTSFALIDRGLLSSAQLSSANRWLIQLAGVSGVVLVASEYLRSLDQIHQVLRALSWGSSVCGLAAACQYWLRFDLVPDIRKILVGFKINDGTGALTIGSRSGISRVAGTAVDPIELGVVAAMLLPLALYLAINDTGRPAVNRWLPVVFTGICIPITVSRAAIIAAVIAVGSFIVMLPSARRLTALAVVPVALGAIFLTAHRLLGTLKSYFLVGTADNSISHRVNNYPYALHLISQAPWFGHGGGTYIASATADLGSGHILDDEYLDAGIELGLAGVVALAFFLLWPAVTAFRVRARARARGDQRLMDLSAALAGGAMAGLICSATFDSFGFAMFPMVEALIMGLTGATWLLVRQDGDPAEAPSTLRANKPEQLTFGIQEVGPGRIN